MNNPSVQRNKKSSIVKTRSHFKSINGFFKNAQHITVLISENSPPPLSFVFFFASAHVNGGSRFHSPLPGSVMARRSDAAEPSHILEAQWPRHKYYIAVLSQRV